MSIPLDSAAALITTCSRCTFDETQRSDVRAILEQELDWQRVLRLAERNYVLPLLFESLKRDARDMVPDAIYEHLATQRKLLKFRARLFCDELVRLNGILSSAGISVLHYKGPVCSETLYGDVYRRTYLDLDFLVKREDLDQVSRLLSEEGYQRKENLTKDEQDHFERKQKEYAFVSGLICIEPHWSLTAHRYPFAIDYAGLWRRARAHDFEGTELLTFSPRDMLIILSMIGAKGQWERLQMVTDIAQYYRSMDDSLAGPVLKDARALGCERIVLVAARLAAVLLDAPIPDAIRARILRDAAAVERISHHVIDLLFRREAPQTFLGGSPHIFSSLLFAMRERRRDRIAYLVRTTTTPTSVHLKRFPLPRWAYPLYRAIVPINDYAAVPAVHAVRSCISRWRSA